MAKIDRLIKVMKNDLLKTGYLALSGPTVMSDRKTDGQSKQERAALFATKKVFRNVQAIIYSYFCNASSLLSIIIIQIMHAICTEVEIYEKKDFKKKRFRPGGNL